MKVKLAAHTLSSSIADALAFCQNDLGLPEFRECTATVEFIRIVDRVFHLLNSRNPMAKGFKSPLRVQNEFNWRPFLLFAIEYLQGLKFVDGQPLSSSLRQICVIGFVITGTSIMSLFDSLNKRNHF